MTYRVRYTPRVKEAIDRQVAYLLEQQAPVDRVAAWVADLYHMADSLAQWPYRHGVAERESAEVGCEIRRMVFGRYLLFYRVDDERRCVDVVHFRHAAQETNRITDDSTSSDG